MLCLSVTDGACLHAVYRRSQAILTAMSQTESTGCSSPVRDWNLQLSLPQPLYRLFQGAPEDAGLIHLVAAPEDAMHREILDQRDVGSDLQQCTGHASG